MCEGVCCFGVVVGCGLGFCLLPLFWLEWLDRLDAVDSGTPSGCVLSEGGPF